MTAVASDGATAVEDLPVAVSSGQDGVSTARVPAAWWTWGGAQGGLVMALTADAVRQTLPGTTLRTLTTHFLAPVDERRLDLVTTVARQSRSASTVTVRAEQDGSLAALSIAATVEARPTPGVDHRVAMPVVPAPEDCAPFTGAELLFAFPKQLEIRPVDDVLPLSGSALPRLTAWVRLRATELTDVGAALVLLDALAPAAYAAWTAPAVVPTVQLTAHLLADLEQQPAHGWVLVRQQHVRTEAGTSVDECDLWSASGQHLAQARQLRRVLA